MDDPERDAILPPPLVCVGILGGIGTDTVDYSGRTTAVNVSVAPSGRRSEITRRRIAWLQGAAHLVGRDGLLALLQRRGYAIEQQ